MTVLTATPIVNAELLLESPTLFRTWLMRLPRGAIVGQGASDEGCPLAVYLHEQGLVGAVVHAARWQVDDADERGYQLSKWAYHFVNEIDLHYGPGDQITAAQALTVLDEVD
jgi:hypothetical protein